MSTVQEQTIDLRSMIPADRHNLVFKTFDSLAIDQSFIILTDHEPKPLKHQFESLRPTLSQWTYLSKGDPWSIKITKIRAKSDNTNTSSDEQEEGCCGICGD